MGKKDTEHLQPDDLVARNQTEASTVKYFNLVLSIKDYLVFNFSQRQW